MIDTLDEAIAHCHEKAKELRKQATIGLDSMTDTVRVEECKECAADHEQLAEWLTELQERREADRWIPVSERLPEKDGNYIITRLDYGEEVVDCRHFNTHSGFVCSNVTAWKPLPEVYKESEGE